MHAAQAVLTFSWYFRDTTKISCTVSIAYVSKQLVRME